MNSWKQFSLTNRKARQDFEGLGELFSFLFSESGSIYFFMLLGFVAAETIDEADPSIHRSIQSGCSFRRDIARRSPSKAFTVE